MTPTVTHRASMTRTLTIALLAAAFSPRYVSAQSTTAICEASFSWMDNDKGQSPCLVAAFLNGQCLSIPSTSTVLPLEQIPGLTDYYAPPTAGRLVPSDCNCNTVVYSLLAACGLCQGQGFITWTGWDVNCPSVFVERFPDSIPAAVSVPQWAYLDVTASNNFNLTAAIALASENKPDVTSNSNTHTNTNTNTNSSPTSTSSPTSSFSSPHKKSIVGPVVGGVVGGVGGLALVALGIWFWLRRRNQRKENTPQPSAGGGVVLPPSSQGTPDIEKPGYVHSPSPLNAANGAQVLQQEPVLAYSLHDQQYQQQQQLAQAQAQHPTVATTAPSLFSNPSTTATAIPLRPYNPNDPSTFPDALLSYSSPQHQQVTSPVTPATPISSTSLLHTQNTDTSRPFSGVPEVEGTFYVPPTQQQPQQLPMQTGGYGPASGQGLHHHSQSQSQSQSGGGSGGYQPTEY